MASPLNSPSTLALSPRPEALPGQPPTPSTSIWATQTMASIWPQQKSRMAAPPPLSKKPTSITPTPAKTPLPSSITAPKALTKTPAYWKSTSTRQRAAQRSARKAGSTARPQSSPNPNPKPTEPRTSPMPTRQKTPTTAPIKQKNQRLWASTPCGPPSPPPRTTKK